MTQEIKTEVVLGDSSTGFGHQVRGTREGLGGYPPSDFSRRGTEVTMPIVEVQPPTNDVIPTCPLCHTSTTAVTVHTLREGAYWRCTRCGQMWDAFRLQTAANYTRHAEQLVRRNAHVAY